MRIFRCDICAKAFDPRDFVPNKIIFIEDSSDPRFRDGEPSQWDKAEMPQPLTPGQYRAEYHICPNCFGSIRDLLNRLSDQK